MNCRHMDHILFVFKDVHCNVEIFFLFFLSFYKLPEILSSYPQNRLNITKTIRKYSIDRNLRSTGSEFESGPVTKAIKHDDESDEEYGEGSVTLNAHNFDRIAHQYVYLISCI